MSVEDEIELRDLVAQTLETNGCLAKIRAQLRASIFLALDEDVMINKQQPLLNNNVKIYLETEEGKAMFCVVREFLEFFNLYFTLSVFDPESHMGNGYKYEGREKMVKDLGLDITDDTTVPLLLQLIKIAQTKAKNLKINLNISKDDVEENKSIYDNTPSHINKTDSNNTFSNEINADNDKVIENLGSVPEKLNATFDLSSPTVNFNIAKKSQYDINKQSAQMDGSKDQVLDSVHNKKEEKDDDTYGDTSSIAEDSVAAANLENNIEVIVNGTEEGTLLNETLNDSEISQPILKDFKVIEKSKLSTQKSEKLKSKNSLSTLSDLPPLQLNKSRVNDILPSLYSKEFRDKSNLRELDKLFDMEAEYEEDFICSGDDLSLKSNIIKSEQSISNLDDSQLSCKSVSPDISILNKRDLKQKTSNIIKSDCNNKQVFKSSINGSKTKEALKNIDIANKSECNSNSINENLDINSSD